MFCVTRLITHLVLYKHFTRLEILLRHTCVDKWGSERCFIVLFATQYYSVLHSLFISNFRYIAKLPLYWDGSGLHQPTTHAME